MNEKKEKIIESAMKLFASQGFYKTTIQEIADRSGVSKGAIYLYFKSKEDLMVSVFHYYYDLIRKKVESVDDEQLSPREKFMKQLDVQLKEVIEHRDFIMMQFREQALSLNEEIDHLIYQIRTETMSWYEDSLLHIYGDEILPYLTDLTILLDGFVKSYLQVLFLDDVRLDLHRLARYLCERLDDLVAGFVRKKEPPLVTDQVILSFLNQRPTKDVTFGKVKKELVNMLHTLNLIELERDKKEELKATLDVMLKELTKEAPREVLFKGLLVNFKGIAELEESRRKIMAWLAQS